MARSFQRRTAAAFAARLVSISRTLAGDGVDGKLADALSRVEPTLLLRGAATLLRASTGANVRLEEISRGESMLSVDTEDLEAHDTARELLHAVTRLGHLPVEITPIEDRPGAFIVRYPPPLSGPLGWFRPLGGGAPPPSTLDPSLLLEVDQLRAERSELQQLVEKLQANLAQHGSDLSRAEARYRALVEDLGVGVLLLSASGTVEFASPLAAEVLGRQSDEVLGQAATSLFTTARSPDLSSRLKSARKGDTVAPFDVTVPTATGEHAAATLQMTLAPLEGGPRIVGTVHRTLRPELSNRLMQAQRLEAIGRMAGALAHQINNPAASVRLNLETAQRGLAELERGDTAKAAVPSLVAAVDEALQSIERIAVTLADLNAFSDERQRRQSKVDVDLTVARAVRLLENRIHHVARLELDFGAHCDVMADESLFAQIVVNLLNNAAAAIEQSERRQGTIWVTTRVIGENVTIEVSDDGCGLDHDDLTRLRQPLVSGWERVPSTGLGLATCDRVLATLGGTLDAAPLRGGGTTFFVTVPLPIEGKNDQSVRRIVPKAKFVGHPRILMVDDERPILRAFQRLLSSKYDVTTAESIDQFEEILARGKRFDLVLCDLMMPKRSIVEAFDDLSTRYPWIGRRLVICTGGGFSDEATTFVAEKRLRLLDKPFSPTDIERALEEMPGRRTDSWLA